MFTQPPVAVQCMAGCNRLLLRTAWELGAFSHATPVLLVQFYVLAMLEE